MTVVLETSFSLSKRSGKGRSKGVSFFTVYLSHVTLSLYSNSLNKNVISICLQKLSTAALIQVHNMGYFHITNNACAENFKNI